MPTTMKLFVLTLLVCHRMNLNKWDLLPQMPNSVLIPQAFFLCGKLYYFSGHEENKPRAMAYKPTLNTWESLPEPPNLPSSQNRDLFSAAYSYPIDLQILDVDTKCWRVNKFKTNEGLILCPD